ncbi:MAG: ATP-dependent protease LonB [Limnochordia bacterium]|jgi:Lon-like ATP-dependent protease|nr:ATP-dependent protease LonB [Limnochordia bacterium]HOB40586.1 ATP-dependent protease LonB [Limnochordia bacterium]HOQ74665.1 ATP-dependent protease LonB [Limnochordia bacterium]HPU65924.1 ATP-dependent protease LonB [Limnochordia bacterium]HPZ79788.1 ATP-dependent protease LonB [Limnochordia bacterium]
MEILGLINLFFAIVIGLYFWNLLRQQQGSKTAVDRESRREMEKLRRLKSIALSEPLSELTRPKELQEIVGQSDGLKALRAALCGANPQHVIIYGPPGVGKTAAARVVLEEAKKNPLSPFAPDAAFVEVDATTARFDERGIADPLLGSVHDPIYQGAGPLGVAGIPQPKPGAVTKAHGGVLFIDEIGELHPIQLNKLLKVLEDRRVFLDSAYYSADDHNIPQHIHDIFQNGLPADFRLVGATTRLAEELPPALRSRCLEIYFRSLTPEEIGIIAANASAKIKLPLEPGALEEIKRFAANGRDAVNMVQLAGGVAFSEGRRTITKADVQWVLSCGQYTPRPQNRIRQEPAVGVVNGLAMYGPNLGTVIEVEAAAAASRPGRGQVKVTGIMDEEEFGRQGRTMRRRSQALSSVDNVLTVLRTCLALRPQDYDIHINFPGGIPVDGPSAGVSMVTAVASVLTNQPVSNLVAMTGEVTIRGLVRAVGGIVPKVRAAGEAGVKKVLIPKENWQESFALQREVEVVPVSTIQEVLEHALLEAADQLHLPAAPRTQGALLGAFPKITPGIIP